MSEVKIPFEYELDEQGNILVDPKILIPVERNKSIYGENIEENNSSFEQIEKSMVVQGINDTPIPVYIDKSLKGGHTRLHIALKHNFKKVKIRLAGNPPKNALEAVSELIGDNAHLREKSYLHCLNEFIEYEKAYWEVNNFKPGMSILKETIIDWVEEIDSSTALSISRTVLDQLRLVKERDPNLFKDVNSGKITPKKAYDNVKNTKLKPSPRKIREVMRWMSDKNLQEDVIKSFNTSRKSFLNKIGYTDENGKFINVITGEFTDIEENATTGMYSHILANCTTSVFRKRMPKVNAVSPRKGGDPDTQFKAFDLDNVEPLRLETKFAQTTKRGTFFYGGQGATSINPHEFILALRQGLNHFIIIVATMSSMDWKSKTNGSVSDFDLFMKNHYDEKGKTWFPIFGDIVIGNYDTEYHKHFKELI